MRGMSNKKYHGRYTAHEFNVAKMSMLYKFRGELSVGKIDDFLRYCAKNDWPAERRETYRYASENGEPVENPERPRRRKGLEQ